MKKTMFLLVTMALFAVPVWAADAVAQASPTTDFITALLNQVVFPFLGAGIAALLGWVLLLVKKKMGLSISADTEAMLRDQAMKAVHYAEEWGAARLKQSIPTTGADKYGTALDKLRGFIPTISQAQAETYVQSAVGAISGVGASKAVGQ